MKVWILLISLFAVLNLEAENLHWNYLPNSPYNSAKQDDIYFINADTGWSVNGSGKVYRTHDGGKTWENIFTQTGTFFRCVSFLNYNIGFAGNIGTNYFPNVTDTNPIYKTTDAGETWTPIIYSGPTVTGLCAIDYVATPFINSGNIDTNYTIYAAGRVGGPAYLLKSTDAGETWVSSDLNSYIGMITDIKFINKNKGFIFGASDPDFTKSNAVIIATNDGGATWEKVYQSNRTYELMWKASFPSEYFGYATLLSYSQTDTKRLFLSTRDGGKSWNEKELSNNSTKEFGVGFINNQMGWIGGDQTGYFTSDGGDHWTTTNMGKAVNKIRFIKTNDRLIAYAIGLNIYKLDTTISVNVEDAPQQQEAVKIYPNPAQNNIQIEYTNLADAYTEIELYDLQGKLLESVIHEYQTSGNHRLKYTLKSKYSGMLNLVIKQKNSTQSTQFIINP